MYNCYTCIIIRVRATPAGCTNNNHSQCYPDLNANTSVPTDIIQCDGDICICNDCFVLNSSTGRCVPIISSPANCYYYNTVIGACVDNRKTQRSALLLSIFLGYTGAANFHIDQDGLGAAQLILFLIAVTMLSGFFIACFCLCFCACCAGVTKPIFYIAILIVLCACIGVVILTWWITDIGIFGSNRRLDGNGCPLKPNA
jgi:hypothetical protein